MSHSIKNVWRGGNMVQKIPPRYPNSLRECRFAAHETGAATAAAIKVSPFVYRDIEKGYRPLDDRTAAKLAVHWSVPLARLAPSIVPAAMTGTRGPRKRNGHSPVVANLPALFQPPASRAQPPTMILLFAAAAALSPDKWPTAIRVLKALADDGP